MKKKWFALLGAGVALTVAIAAVGCGGGEKEPYKTLNALAAKDYGTVTLTVTTGAGADTLTGTFVATAQEDGVKVTYTYEQWNTFEKEGDSYEIPAEAKTTVSGETVYKDGETVVLSGAPAEADVTAKGLKFAESYFAEVKAEEGSFSAAVTEPASFLQTDITCTGMTVTVAYTAEKLGSIAISYTSSAGTPVTFTYAFA